MIIIFALEAQSASLLAICPCVLQVLAVPSFFVTVTSILISVCIVALITKSASFLTIESSHQVKAAFRLHFFAVIILVRIIARFGWNGLFIKDLRPFREDNEGEEEKEESLHLSYFEFLFLFRFFFPLKFFFPSNYSSLQIILPFKFFFPSNSSSLKILLSLQILLPFKFFFPSNSSSLQILFPFKFFTALKFFFRFFFPSNSSLR